MTDLHPLHTLQDLRDVLAEEPAGLRAPDLGTVIADGRTLRRRRTSTGRLGAAAAAVLLVAGVLGAVARLSSEGGRDPDVVAAQDRIDDQAALAQRAAARTEARVRTLVGDRGLDLGAWSGTRPDGDEGSRALPRDDREWATLQWIRYSVVLDGGASLFVLTDNGPDEEGSVDPRGELSDEERSCTHVYERCTLLPVPGGTVAIERGRTDEGLRAVRASFSPAEQTYSWVLAELKVRPGQEWPYPVSTLVDLVADPDMSLPSPLGADELPDEG